jgi:hypothetical protein
VKTPTEESGRRARGRRFACTGSHVGNFPQGGWNIAYNPDCPAQRSIAAATHRNAACVRASITDDKDRHRQFLDIARDSPARVPRFQSHLAAVDLESAC